MRFNDSTMDTPEMMPLVADYIKFRLEKQNLQWMDKPPTLPPPGKIEQTMRVLGQELEERYNEVFSEMCNQLHITPNTAQQTFVAIINELFSDGVRWGRIVALFSFAGALAVQCVEKEMPVLVPQIADWVSQYINNHLASWIQENGGWVRIAPFIYSCFCFCFCCLSLSLLLKLHANKPTLPYSPMP